MAELIDHFLCRATWMCKEHEYDCKSIEGFECAHRDDCESCSNAGERTCFECKHFERGEQSDETY